MPRFSSPDSQAPILDSNAHCAHHRAPMLSEHKETPVRSRLKTLAILLAIVAALSATASCQTARAGQRCKGGAAQDATHVLACKKGRWTRWISKAEGQRLLDAYRASQTTAPPSTTTPVVPPRPVLAPTSPGSFSDGMLIWTGLVESATYTSSGLRIVGWAFSAKDPLFGGTPNQTAFYLNMNPNLDPDHGSIATVELSVARPDVQALFPSAPLLSGFDMTIPTYAETACLTVRTDSGHDLSCRTTTR